MVITAFGVTAYLIRLTPAEACTVQEVSIANEGSASQILWMPAGTSPVHLDKDVFEGTAYLPKTTVKVVGRVLTVKTRSSASLESACDGECRIGDLNIQLFITAWELTTVCCLPSTEVELTAELITLLILGWLSYERVLTVVWRCQSASEVWYIQAPFQQFSIQISINSFEL